MYEDITTEFWLYNDKEADDFVFEAIITESHRLSSKSRKLSAIVLDEKGTIYIEQDFEDGQFTLLPIPVQKQIIKFLNNVKDEYKVKKIYNVIDREYAPIYIK